MHEIIYNNVQLFFILLLVLDSGLFRHHFKEIALERCHELPDTYLSSPSCLSCAWNNLQQCPTLLLVLDSGLFWHHFKETALERCHELPDTYLSSPSCPNCAWNNLQQCPTLLHSSSSSWFWVVSTPFQRNCSWKVPRAPWYLFVKP